MKKIIILGICLLVLIGTVFAMDFNDFKSKCHVIFGPENGKIVVKSVDCGEKQSFVEEKITEEIKCVFNNSTTEQECYSEFGSCKGINECYFKFDGVKDQNITLKSSCGGYAYAIIDGVTGDAAFDCISQTYLSASWECYDGLSLNGENKIALNSETWRNYADQACANHCDAEKCDVMYFEVM